MGKKNRDGKTSTLKTFETANKEYGSKRIVEDESVDLHGLIRRSRICNQTGFDQLYINGLINASEHEAAHLFMGALSKSGCYVKASDPGAIHYTPFSKVGDSISSRVMAFSSAYRTIASRLDMDCANVLVLFIVSNEEPVICVKSFRHKIVPIRRALKELVSFYGIREVIDPRSIVRTIS